MKPADTRRTQAERYASWAHTRLKRVISDDTVLKTGRRTGVALFDYPRQEFAKLRAVRDAETRAARELAELIYADLAMALGR
jgi:LPS-assembly lipoprotein